DRTTGKWGFGAKRNPDLPAALRVSSLAEFPPGPGSTPESCAIRILRTRNQTSRWQRAGFPRRRTPALPRPRRARAAASVLSGLAPPLVLRDRAALADGRSLPCHRR